MGQKICPFWKEACRNGAMRYRTNKPCRKGHNDFRWTSSRNCVSCVKERVARNTIDIKFRQAEWYAKNKELVNEAGKRWYRENRESVIERTSTWALNNRDRCNQYSSKWTKNNPAKRRAKVGRRRATMKHASPVWADKAAIARIYTEAHRIQKETGIPHHVDHIIPLHHKAVCGLHVPGNLQIITALENVRKTNKFQPFSQDTNASD